MSNERVILCGSAKARKADSKKKPIELMLSGNAQNIKLKISDITDKMVTNLPPRLIDLLEIATYIYCADQATTRGGTGIRDYGANWRRQFHFHIPVREPDFWSSDTALSTLRNTIGFLSEDEYHFDFVNLKDPPPMSLYLDLDSGGSKGFNAEEIVMFSGGLDSLGGAIQEAIVGDRNIALVSHRSSPKIDRRQRDLVTDFGKHCKTAPFHVPVWIHKDKALGREYTQRTRSFLYASLGAVVAGIFDLHRIRFYENGIVSINLPISAQVIGARGTRTTHPQAINGFSDLFSVLFEKKFTVENPFLFMTKSEVVKSILDANCKDLIKHTVSCTHVWEMTTRWSHCGICSQCIDRRFATLSAGCTDQDDPEEMYKVDLLKGKREKSEEKTMLESYVRTAKEIKDMSDDAFFVKFGEIHRVLGHIKGHTINDAASNILSLYRRHVSQVWNVITQGTQKHTEEMYDAKLPDSCLLVLALPEEYKKPTEPKELLPSVPALVLDEIKDGEANQNLLARIIGSGRFNGVNKKIGSRELFFVILLFQSTRAYTAEGEQLTVITEEEAARELLQWSKDSYLKFEGKDKDKPAHRIQKMWGEFVRQIEKESKLKGLFTNTLVDSSSGEKLYGLRLRPEEKQILVPSIPSLFKNITT